MRTSVLLTLALLVLLAPPSVLPAPAGKPPAPVIAPVTAQVTIVRPAETAKKNSSEDDSDAVVWLAPLDSQDNVVGPRAASTPQLVQKDKMFEPHVLVIQAGSMVAFPNKDPYFHNVFSLFDGKRFDLGLYEAGTSKMVKFDRVGVSFIFCNIHENMAAVIVAVPTPYFGKSDAKGHLTIAGVPDGRYEMHVWYEHCDADELKRLDRTLTIADSTRTLDAIHVPYSALLNLAHKNKYGEDYVAPPSGPGSYSK
jgi:plastocyanin